MINDVTNGFKAYKTYLALKCHFNSNYDCDTNSFTSLKFSSCDCAYNTLTSTNFTSCDCECNTTSNK